MPRKKPIIPSQLRPVSLALAKLELTKGHILASMPCIFFGFLLITIGTFKPFTVHFHPVWSWLITGFGALLLVRETIELFQLRELMQKSHEKILAFVFGAVFIVVLLIAAFAVPNPTAFQYTVFRIVLALAAAGVAAMFSGFLEMEIPKVLRAGGALAVFAVVYFYAPAALEKLQQ